MTQHYDRRRIPQSKSASGPASAAPRRSARQRDEHCEQVEALTGAILRRACKRAEWIFTVPNGGHRAKSVAGR